MPVIFSVLGWSTFGLAARCWQLALQKRNIFENLGGHALSISAFGTMGYFYYGAERRLEGLLEEKKEALRQVRGQAATAPAGDDEE